jgi:hypothetical protein
MKIVNNNNPLRLCLLFGLFVFFTATTSLSQTSDDFSDNDFTNNPTWTGATADYIVNTSQQLQLNASGAGTSYATSPSGF